MGQRHVFFYSGETFFAFATEKKGLWALPQVPRLLPDAEIADTLRLGGRRTRDALTAPNPVKWLPGGTILTLTADGLISLNRYWEPKADPAHLGHDEAYYLKAYREVLAEAVACRLRRATTPAGVLFSGGFDTTSIAALAGPVLTPKGRKLVAASSVMPEDYRGTIHCPRAWIEVSRKHMPHLDVHYVTREGLDIFTDLEKAFYSADNFHSPGRYANDALYRAIASTGARVAMDGHGGDYTVNPTAQRWFINRLARGQFRLFAREYRARRRFLRVSRTLMFRTAILQHLIPGLRALVLRRRGGLPAFADATPINKAFIEAMTTGARKTAKHRAAGSPHAMMKATLDSLHSASAMGGSISSAAHGMEFTQPFHDKRVVELGLAIPEELWLKNGRERHFARTALADLLPPAFQTRPPGSEDLQPDFLAMAKRIEPRVLAEIDRMEQAGKLARIFDFAQMRRLLTRTAPAAMEHRSGQRVRCPSAAMRAFVLGPLHRVVLRAATPEALPASCVPCQGMFLRQTVIAGAVVLSQTSCQEVGSWRGERRNDRKSHGIEVITVAPEQDGWTVAHDGETNQRFQSGATAEAIARQLGQAIARGGRPAEVRIFLRDGSLAGRFLYPPAANRNLAAKSAGIVNK